MPPTSQEKVLQALREHGWSDIAVEPARVKRKMSEEEDTVAWRSSYSGRRRNAGTKVVDGTKVSAVSSLPAEVAEQLPHYLREDYRFDIYFDERGRYIRISTNKGLYGPDSPLRVVLGHIEDLAPDRVAERMRKRIAEDANKHSMKLEEARRAKAAYDLDHAVAASKAAAWLEQQFLAEGVVVPSEAARAVVAKIWGDTDKPFVFPAPLPVSQQRLLEEADAQSVSVPS